MTEEMDDEKVYTHKDFLERSNLVRDLADARVKIVTDQAKSSVAAAEWRDGRTIRVLYDSEKQVLEPKDCVSCGASGDEYAAAKNYPNGLRIMLEHEHSWTLDVAHHSTLPRRGALCAKCIACALVTLADEMMAVHPNPEMKDTVDDISVKVKDSMGRLFGEEG